MSADCWPDIALGPLPHFYPFIVNDPGEGAQAKRRSHAVIIDHLMPPLARAELYGAMAELEALTDEYYQALDMDPRREALIRSQILAHLRDTGIEQELAHVASGECEAEILNALDTFLCDIKESQIRHGLHILGTLPPEEKRAGTLVALLRLPRGESVASRGLLHNLASDLGLDFDPLAAGNEPWQGTEPAILSQQLDTPGAPGRMPASAWNCWPSAGWPTTSWQTAAWMIWPRITPIRQRSCATPATSYGSPCSAA
ncbi:hypothetical protein HSBAA_39010 [Vreelandella sulfidaeris]|uniref:CobN/magnesium chelatase domain-containing protein n=1 Tax=Vreelandella sulfidaeris TaxID=115553 RepID=A0A455U9B3_9GAMM|nr:hypothetical protein HSBAA_39010 [Halomonas sulfidaeris]